MNDSSAAASSKDSAPARQPRGVVRPFLGLIDAVIVPGKPTFDFDGAVAEEHARSVWTWMVRDLAPDLIDADLDETDPAACDKLELVLPELLQRARATIANLSGEPERRLRVQLGGDDVLARMPMILQAIKGRALFDKAQAFGRAVNGMSDDAALALALQSMPLNDPAVTALLMQAALGQVNNPGRLMGAVIRIADSSTEQAVQRAGFGPLVDAILSHAQAQIPPLQQFGAFADIDLICRSVARFHRLMRAVTGYVELGRVTRWSTIVAGLTTTVSELIEPRLRDVGPTVNLALRRHNGTDRIDSDQVLSALSGCYVLATVRDCRQSLALNALFDQIWTQVGQALEIHVQRNLDLFRHNPADRVIAARLDAAIKMAELRFNPDYAEVLRRARDGAERRAG